MKKYVINVLNQFNQYSFSVTYRCLYRYENCLKIFSMV